MSRIRYALRALAKTPVVTLVVVLSLGLGIGANTAIFSVLYQVVLRALPVQKPDELVILTSPGEFKGGRNSTDNSGGMESIFSYRMFRGLEKDAQGFAGIAGFRNIGANLAYRNQTINGGVLLVSGGYFPTLGVQPLIGRTLDRGDDVHGAGNPVAVLGYGYWKDRLGGDPGVLNQPLRVNGQVLTIVGVAPKGFGSTVLGSEPNAYVPLALKPRMTPGWDGTDNWKDYWIYAIGRVAPGVTRQRAEAGLNSAYSGLVEQQIREQPSDEDNDWRKRYAQSRMTLKDGRQGQSSARSEMETPVYILMAATGLVLLIAMANAANLLLARSAQRRKELAIRTALGAGRREIMGQILTEALLVSLAGGVAGILLGLWTLDILMSQINDPGSVSYTLTARLDWPVLLFTAALSVASGVLFGLYPAFDAARATTADTLKDASGSVSSGTGTARVRRLLVCAQVMISAVLLIPTGLFLKSLVNLTRVDLGIRTENMYTFGLSPELNGYKPAQSRVLFERLEQDLARIPGVRNVSGSLVPLIAGNNWGNSLTVEGYRIDKSRARDSHSMFNQVSAGFFSAMGMPLVAGREFNERDVEGGPKVAVVNEEFARHFFGTQNPLGRRFGMGWGKGVKLDHEIVGVVKNANYSSVKQKVPKVYFTPWRQSNDLGSLQMYVRATLPPAQVVPQIRKTVANLDANLPVEDLRSMEEQVLQNIRGDRIVLQLAGAFAILATALSMLGLYGVMAYSVTRRTREIGIRVALGAGRGEIRGIVMREVLAILAIGLVTGIPAALALARYTESQLFGVKSWDAVVVCGAALALALAALAAGWIPAHRATRVNPIQALRYE